MLIEETQSTRNEQQTHRIKQTKQNFSKDTALIQSEGMKNQQKKKTDTAGNTRCIT